MSLLDPKLSAAAVFLCVLHRAGCRAFIDDDQLFISPPLRRVEWPGDPEEAIEQHYWELKDLVMAEDAVVH